MKIVAWVTLFTSTLDVLADLLVCNRYCLETSRWNFKNKLLFRLAEFLGNFQSDIARYAAFGYFFFTGISLFVYIFEMVDVCKTLKYEEENVFFARLAKSLVLTLEEVRSDPRGAASIRFPHINTSKWKRAPINLRNFSLRQIFVFRRLRPGKHLNDIPLTGFELFRCSRILNRSIKVLFTIAPQYWGFVVSNWKSLTLRCKYWSLGQKTHAGSHYNVDKILWHKNNMDLAKRRECGSGDHIRCDERWLWWWRSHGKASVQRSNLDLARIFSSSMSWKSVKTLCVQVGGVQENRLELWNSVEWQTDPGITPIENPSRKWFQQLVLLSQTDI